MSADHLPSTLFTLLTSYFLFLNLQQPHQNNSLPRQHKPHHSTKSCDNNVSLILSQMRCRHLGWKVLRFMRRCMCLFVLLLLLLIDPLTGSSRPALTDTLADRAEQRLRVSLRVTLIKLSWSSPRPLAYCFTLFTPIDDYDDMINFGLFGKNPQT